MEALSKINELESASMIHARLGMEFFAQKDYKKALIEFKDAIYALEALHKDLSQKSNVKNQSSKNLKSEISEIIEEVNQKIAIVLKKLAEEAFQECNYIYAIVYYEESLKITPEDANVYNTIGYLYKIIGNKYQHLDEQIKYFEKAIELDPQCIQTIRNLAVTYPLVGRGEEAVKYFKKLLELEPVVDDYVAYSHLQIQLGNFTEGFKYYEYRFQRKGNPLEYPKFDKPRWEGQNISDKTLLVHYEQGFGDSIQFFRYLEQTKPLAKKIIFRVQDELVDLFRINIENIDIVGLSTPLSELSFDYEIPLLSILHATNATIDNIPFTQSYLKADKTKTEKYKKEFFNNNCMKIGISYNGAQFGNERRNVPLGCFYPLAKLKNIKLYSFQKGFGAEQLKNVPSDIEIIDLGATFNDFSDTAAAMANVDLFITSDNSVFNLAGAMGKKTFVLLNKHSEWRWFYDEETTPWYDSVKIFKKQNEEDDWNLPIEKIIKILNI